MEPMKRIVPCARRDQSDGGDGDGSSDDASDSDGNGDGDSDVDGNGGGRTIGKISFDMRCFRAMSSAIMKELPRVPFAVPLSPPT
jgi:hypothetical protein